MIQLADSVEGAYEQRGDMYVKLLRDYERAIVEYDQAIERNPSGVTLRRKRATAFCENGHWSAAAADFAQAGQHDPDSALFPYWAALAQLGAGDAVGYGETCTALLQHFAQTGDPETARWVAWTCALAPDAVADLLLAVEFAEQAVAADPDNNMYRANRS